MRKLGREFRAMGWTGAVAALLLTGATLAGGCKTETSDPASMSATTSSTGSGSCVPVNEACVFDSDCCSGFCGDDGFCSPGEGGAGGAGGATGAGGGGGGSTNPGCLEISLAEALNMFGEADLDPIGDAVSTDIIQAFLAEGLSPGTYPVVAPSNHNSCFGSGHPTCVQVRQDFATAASEFICTEGTLTISSGPPYVGSLDGLILQPYTQDGTGLITFGDPADCLWLASAPIGQ